MRFLPALVVSILPAGLSAHDYNIGGLTVMHPMAFETAQTAQTGAGYLSVSNEGDTEDRLIAVEAEFPRVEVHNTIVENGVSKMIHLEEGIPIPVGETLTLAPGGHHVMFMGLNGDPFEVGEEIPATLVFENAGRLDVVFNVEARDGDHAGHDDHDHMNHSDDHEKDGDHSGH